MIAAPGLRHDGAEPAIRRRLLVRGIVQGVGFRPFVYALATRLQLDGLVGNDSGGVFIEIEGPAERLDRFEAALHAEAPPLAHIHDIRRVQVVTRSEPGFIIVASRTIGGTSTLISPDLAICDDCLRELFDPEDRRYQYPFINCTNCGPRFTIIRDLPYDRPFTTMAPFALCPACAQEYADPLNRRYHAQPIACPACGPRVWLRWAHHSTPPIYDAQALAQARAALQGGGILAIKGLGGFHLACDARSEQAVGELRRRKGRGDKPFAVMARDLHVAERFAWVEPEEARRLASRERPIVLLRKRSSTLLAPAIAPENAAVGVMLPYTPLHYLLIGDFPLVMTSGNVSGEPIETDNEAALVHLAPLVDGFVLHDRVIHLPCDDSVLRVFSGADLPIRRSRGFAPLPVQLPSTLPPTLAVGGELKSTICVARTDQAILSQHLGDMENLETQEQFARVVEHLQTIFHVTPERIVCDLHPGYFSSRWAAQYAAMRDLPLVKVQHHHAHIAATMAEHGLDGSRPVVGVAFDGTGYGPDQAIWGGEVLIADYRGYRRAAHLRYVPLPGGDAAIAHPARCALAYLWAAGLPWDEDLPPVAATSDTERSVLRRQFETGLRCTPTSSMGRLFDAAAALLGLHPEVTFEAQAAIALEALLSAPEGERELSLLRRHAHFDAGETGGYRFAIGSAPADGARIIDPAPVLAAMITDLRVRVPPAAIAARFHWAVAALVATLAGALCEELHLDSVALSGGVFQNMQLLALTTEACAAAGVQVIVHHLVPPNDGGLALGQAMVGGRQCLEAEGGECYVPGSAGSDRRGV